ncbi:SDR family NAD(P)-dependent oxidoreductase [Gloeobacter morelensis]|uniref:SDR family oxidoreductase n=1 Tax=Gloeobacter morelensis MG652769 TaxID=2781736 RepID=A0ABY3PQU7_9CYAN|nr:SDR family oxidoreductase [Gloeobacter morelensis]UFP95980.1 SDR family oxidoreductase [Gloeobacter morelensis MG652769]
MPAVLITGANGGIGQALCRVFLEADYKVIASDCSEARCPCDAFVRFDVMRVCQDEDYRAGVLQKVREVLGDQPLSALINNAAVQILGRTEQITASHWHRTLQTNLIGPFLLAQGLLQELERACGSVINIASVHARATKPGFVCYATSKAALVGLTQAMAVDLGGRVRVNAISPAATATPMLLAGFAGNEASLRQLAAMHPTGRIAEPEEVAHLALFLASGRAGSITGASLAIDGGIAVRLHDPE